MPPSTAGETPAATRSRTTTNSEMRGPCRGGALGETRPTLRFMDRENLQNLDANRGLNHWDLEPLNRSSRREEAYSISAEGNWSLLTSAATRFRGRVAEGRVRGRRAGEGSALPRQ